MTTTTTAAKGPKARRSHRSHRLAGLGAALVASAAVVLAGGSAAQASYQDGQPYWADDWCSYSVVNGAWTGNTCVRTYTDELGAVYPKVYSFYAYDAYATDHLGALTLQIDDQEPRYIQFRVPGSPLFQGGVWARQARGDGSAAVEIQTWDPVANAWGWTVLAPAVPATTGGGDLPSAENGWGSGTGGVIGGGYSSSSPNAVIAKMQADHDQRLAGITLAPACNSSYNGCA